MVPTKFAMPSPSLSLKLRCSRNSCSILATVLMFSRAASGVRISTSMVVGLTLCGLDFRPQAVAQALDRGRARQSPFTASHHIRRRIQRGIVAKIGRKKSACCSVGTCSSRPEHYAGGDLRTQQIIEKLVG